jgi:hypothetical protein
VILMGLGNRAGPFLSPLFIIIIMDSSSPSLLLGTRQQREERAGSDGSLCFSHCSVTSSSSSVAPGRGADGRASRRALSRRCSVGSRTFVYLPSPPPSFAGCVQCRERKSCAKAFAPVRALKALALALASLCSFAPVFATVRRSSPNPAGKSRRKHAKLAKGIRAPPRRHHRRCRRIFFTGLQAVRFLLLRRAIMVAAGHSLMVSQVIRGRSLRSPLPSLPWVMVWSGVVCASVGCCPFTDDKTASPCREARECNDARDGELQQQGAVGVSSLYSTPADCWGSRSSEASPLSAHAGNLRRAYAFGLARRPLTVNSSLTIR